MFPLLNVSSFVIVDTFLLLFFKLQNFARGTQGEWTMLIVITTGSLMSDILILFIWDLVDAGT